MYHPPGSFNVSVEAAIIKDSKILVTRRAFEREHAGGEWEILSGRVNQNETLEDAVKREVKEEIALEVEVIQPINTWHFYRGPEKVEHQGITFLCKYLSGEVVLEKDEQIDYKWATVEEAEKLITDTSILKSIEKAKQFL